MVGLLAHSTTAHFIFSRRARPCLKSRSTSLFLFRGCQPALPRLMCTEPPALAPSTGTQQNLTLAASTTKLARLPESSRPQLRESSGLRTAKTFLARPRKTDLKTNAGKRTCASVSQEKQRRSSSRKKWETKKSQDFKMLTSSECSTKCAGQRAIGMLLHGRAHDSCERQAKPASVSQPLGTHYASLVAAPSVTNSAVHCRENRAQNQSYSH